MSNGTFFSFAQAIYTSSESDQPYPNLATITINRSGNLDFYSEVEVLLAGGSATQDDYASPFAFPQLVSFQPGEETKTIEFYIMDDFEFEGTETMNLQLQTIPGSPDTFIGEHGTASLEILDNEVSYIEFAQDVYKGNENEQAVVTLTRMGNLDNYADVEVFWTDGSANEGLDYGSSYGSPQFVTFQPGEKTQTIIFDLFDDFEFEGSETVNLQLQTFPGSPDTFLGVNDTASLEILDDEVANISFSQAVYTASEENDQPYPNLATITLNRTGNLDYFSEVEVMLAGGSATEGSDYYPFYLPQFVSFQPGEETQTIQFEIWDDPEMEGTETLNLELQTIPGSIDTFIGEHGTTTLNILDNEVANISFSQAVYTASEESDQPYPNLATITLNRTGNLDNYSDVEVLLAGGSATEGFDYYSLLALPELVTFQPGQATQTIEFDIFDDLEMEGTETINLQLQTIPGNPDTFIGEHGTASLEILDNEVSYIEFAQDVYKGNENEQAVVTLTRMGNLDNYADVEVFWTDGSANEGLDYGSSYGSPQFVTFQPGEKTQTIIFDLFDDFEFEGSETVNLQLQTFPGSPDTFLGVNHTASLEILDDEVANISFAQAVYTASESDQPYPNLATITLTRTGNLNNYSEVEVKLAGGSATEGFDYYNPMGFPQLVSFQPGQATQIIEFDIFDDLEMEGTETINLELQTIPGNPDTFIGQHGTTTLNILDNEVANISFAQAVYTTSESDQPYPNLATITLNRTGNLNNYSDVEVKLAGGSATEGFDYYNPMGSPQLVSFQPGQATQIIEFEIFNDGEIEGTETINLELQTIPGSFDTFIGENSTATLEISDFDPSSGSGSELSFETGDFTDWTVLGDTNIETTNFGVNPIDGNYQALLTSGVGSTNTSQLEAFLGLNPGELDSLITKNATEGSAIKREITVEAGDTLEFNWNFLTSEGTPTYYNDFAFVSISDGYLDKLADTNSTFNFSNSGFNEETGYGSFSHQFTNSGTFTIAVGVLDAVDGIVDSALLVDNFSIV